MPEPIACTLGPGDQDRRMGEWRELLAQATAREPVPGGLRFSLPSGLAGTAANLAAAEQRCCPFFRFTMVFDGAAVQLTVQAPPEAGPLLATFTDDPSATVSS
jgi:MerR family transcriptional regulator, copper efflux regulator